VHERARAVEDALDLVDVLVEEPERRGVREHQPGRALADLAAEVVEVDVPALVRADVDERVAGHRNARWVRAVRAVRDDDLSAFGLAAVREIGTHQHQSRHLAL
jgi:hypothetical protein